MLCFTRHQDSHPQGWRQGPRWRRRRRRRVRLSLWLLDFCLCFTLASSFCLLFAFFVSSVILAFHLFLLLFLLISIGRSLGVVTGKSKRDQVEAVLLFLFSVCFMVHAKRSWVTGNRRFCWSFTIHILPFGFVWVIAR